jgi:ATP-dependent Lon protease
MKMVLAMNILILKMTGIEAVISGFTREAGLRNLERQIGSVCRKVATNVATGKCKKTIYHS